MRVVVESKNVIGSFAAYPVCVITYDANEVHRFWRMFGCDVTQYPKNEIEYHVWNTRLNTCAKAMRRWNLRIVGRRLGGDHVDLIYCLGETSVVFVYRRTDWEEQARQSLRDKGMSEGDIDDGRGFMFTDHTGIFTGRQPAGR